MLHSAGPEEMKFAVGMALLASGMNAWAAPHILPPGYHVATCLLPPAHAWSAIRAEYLASQIFAGIGLSVDWKDSACPGDRAIRITFQSSTPVTMLPGSLAYALPNEGSHIVVFYDRVQKAIEPPDIPTLLAHVFVHEITHILQGVSHHAETGMMKARWSGADYARMVRSPLPFTDSEIWLIRSGLETPLVERFVSVVNPH